LWRRLRVLEGIFLAPINDSSRPNPLDDPVEYLGIVTRIEQNICDVIALSVKRVFSGSLACLAATK